MSLACCCVVAPVRTPAEVHRLRFCAGADHRGRMRRLERLCSPRVLPLRLHTPTHMCGRVLRTPGFRDDRCQTRACVSLRRSLTHDWRTLGDAGVRPPICCLVSEVARFPLAGGSVDKKTKASTIQFDNSVHLNCVASGGSAVLITQLQHAYCDTTFVHACMYACIHDHIHHLQCTCIHMSAIIYVCSHVNRHVHIAAVVSRDFR